MTVASNLYYPNGLAGARPAKKGKKPRAEFTPTEQQVLTACGRIEGVLKKKNGAFYCHSKDVAPNELGAHVYSRGAELGRDRREVTVTLAVAVKRLVSDGKARWEEDSIGQSILILRGSVATGTRTHRDKYRNDSRQRSRRAA